MSHQEQKEFFKEISKRFPLHFSDSVNILEVGSQDINGSIRDFFSNASGFLGVDLGIAPGVDWVIPGELVELPDGWAEVVISTECFEHCRDWEKVFVNMLRIAAPRSLVIITCASPGRTTHGAIDSDEYSSPFTTSYYKNLGVDDIAEKIALGLYFVSHGFEVNSSSNDLYFWGIRSEVNIQSFDDYWEDPMSRLSRAQGQLGQAAARHSAIQAELDETRNYAEQAKADAEQARADAEQARADAEQARADAELAYESLRIIKGSKLWRLSKPARSIKDVIQRFTNRNAG
jgi:hypothetical protein